MATGLLPVCFGEATKFSADLLEADKTYEADVLFGVTTNTGDADGEVLERRIPLFGRVELENVLQRFHGTIKQIPPMYSALKKDGQPLYRLARQGVEIEREAREVVIRELRLLEFSGDRCRLAVTCSKGTYIRTLAEDIGRSLACGAHLTALRRVAVGDLSIAQAVSLDCLGHLTDEDRNRRLLSPDSLLQTLPAVVLDLQDAQRFSHGNPVAVAVNVVGKCRVYADGRLLGLGHADDSGRLQPSRLVASN